MKVLLMLCISCVAVANAQSVSGKKGVEMTIGVDPLNAQLQLTKDLIELRYGSDDSLQFVMRLSFSNHSEWPVILDNRIKPVSAYMVSRSLENAARRKYEFVVHRQIAHDAGELLPDEINFVGLKPGGSYSREQVFRLHGRGSMPVGRHILQLVVLTWPYSKASNIEWRERWQSKGYLWTDPIMSAAMPFIVKKKPKPVECH